MIDVAKEAARIGGEILLENYGKITSEEVESKGKNNFVTFVDRLSEEKIIEKILSVYPDHDIYAEESGKHKKKSDYRWLIDPLDGTTNYIQGIPLFSVTIALQKDNEIILGVTYDPIRNEMFHAEKGKGAYLNNTRLQISTKENLSTCVVATGFPYKAYQDIGSYLKSFGDFIKNTAGLRRMGSAAIDLAYTASGRFDGFWEFNLSPWDIAAGILLIQEAGGIATDDLGEKNYMETGNIVAANPEIHRQMLSFLA